MKRRAAQSALATVTLLFGGLILGLLTGDIVFRLIPGSSVEDVQLHHAAIAAVPALLGFLVGGAAWGVTMGRLAGSRKTRRMALAGIVGFAPITIVLAVGLGVGEPVIVARAGDALPIHRIFTLLFVPSAFLIAGISTFAIGLGLGNRSLAVTLFWRVGLAAAAAFLFVNLVMEALGWVVGAPGAAARATMLTVMGLGNIAAALVGGALLGRRLPTEGD
jgi:hypothetical protein